VVDWVFDGPPAADLITGFPAQTIAHVDGQFLSFKGPIVMKDRRLPQPFK
jgi:hypothetical protein